MRASRAVASVCIKANAAQRQQLAVGPGLAHGWIDAGNIEALRSSIHTARSPAGALAG